jgi:hypothetical protein
VLNLLVDVYKLLLIAMMITIALMIIVFQLLVAIMTRSFVPLILFAKPLPALHPPDVNTTLFFAMTMIYVPSTLATQFSDVNLLAKTVTITISATYLLVMKRLAIVPMSPLTVMMIMSVRSTLVTLLTASANTLPFPVTMVTHALKKTVTRV